MKKSILNLKGAQELSKNEQKSVNGGKRMACESGVTWCTTDRDCISSAQGAYVCSVGCCITD